MYFLHPFDQNKLINDVKHKSFKIPIQFHLKSVYICTSGWIQIRTLFFYFSRHSRTHSRIHLTLSTVMSKLVPSTIFEMNSVYFLISDEGEKHWVTYLFIHSFLTIFP